METKNFFKSKINWAAIILMLTSLLPLIDETDFGVMNAKMWVLFGISLLIIILRTFFTEGTKSFFRSKINWTAIILILTSILPLIDETNFGEMTAKGWITFAIGLLIIIFRTYFTSQPVVKKK
jgi:hypothetical protein